MNTLISRLYLAAPLMVVVLTQIAWLGFVWCGNDNAGSPLLLRCTFPVLLFAGALLQPVRRPPAGWLKRGIYAVALSLLPILTGWCFYDQKHTGSVIELSLLPFLIAGPVSFIVYVCTVPWVVRRTDLLGHARSHLRRFAPLYLVAGPPAMTYFALCGTLSAVGGISWILILARRRHESFHSGAFREVLIQSGIFTMFHAIEWACSLAGAFGFAWLLRWLGLSRGWFFILFFSLSICAAYRTARLDPGPNFGTGPEILFSPEYRDIVPVILGFVFFAAAVRKRRLEPVVES